MSGFKLKSSSNSTDTNYINTLIDENQNTQIIKGNLLIGAISANITAKTTICETYNQNQFHLVLPQIGTKSQTFKIINFGYRDVRDFPETTNYTIANYSVEIDESLIIGDPKIKLTGTIAITGGQFVGKTGDFLGTYNRGGFRWIANLRGTNEKIEVDNPTNGNIVGGTISRLEYILFVLPTGQDKIESILTGMYRNTEYSCSDTFLVLSEPKITTFVSDPITKTWYATD